MELNTQVGLNPFVSQVGFFEIKARDGKEAEAKEVSIPS